MLIYKFLIDRVPLAGKIFAMKYYDNKESKYFILKLKGDFIGKFNGKFILASQHDFIIIIFFLYLN